MVLPNRFGAGGDDLASQNLRDLLVMVVGLEWTEAFFTAGEKLDGIFPSAFAAFQTLDEAHRGPLMCYSFDKGK